MPWQEPKQKPLVYEDSSLANRATEHPALARAGGIIEFGAFHALLPEH
jgi:hypothetical protein